MTLISRFLTVLLRGALYECWWGREYALDLSSWDGRHLDGVFLVRGGAGDQAVVGSADSYRPKRRAGVLVRLNSTRIHRDLEMLFLSSLL